MIKFVISILLILCMSLSVIALYDGDVNYNKKVTDSKLNLDLNIKENYGTYNIMINDEIYKSTIKLNSNGYVINNISINEISQKDIIDSINVFSFGYNERLYKIIDGKNTTINIKLYIDGYTTIKLE